MEFAYRTNVAVLEELKEFVTDEDIKELQVQKLIRPFVKPALGIVNGDTLRNTYFPSSTVLNTSYDVFISHSHTNEEEAYVLAAWFQCYCGLTCFVDSMAWGSADQLLKEIDNIYCYKKHSKTYDYKKRNFTTSHVHVILSMALLETIKNSRYCIFIESQESISLKTGLKKKTLSPWLYEEIQYMKLFQPQRGTKLFCESLEKGGVFKCAYDATDVNQCPFLDVKDLIKLGEI